MPLLALIFCWILQLAGTAHAEETFNTTHIAKTIDLARLQTAGNVQLLPYFRFTDTQSGLIPVADLAAKVQWRNGNNVTVDNFSSTDSWLAFSAHNSLPEKMKFVIVINNPMIKELQVGKQAGGNIEILYRTGSFFPFAERPVQHRYFVFPLELQTGETANFYINSRYAPRDMLYRTYLWSEPAFFQQTHGIDLWETFYFGILFVIIIYNLCIFFITREYVYLFYSLFVSGAFTIFLSASGYGFQLLWPTLPWLNKSISFIGMGVMLSFSGWFSIAFLSLKQSFPNLTKLLNVLGAMVLVELLFIVILPFDPEFRLVRLLSFTSLPIYLISWIAGIRSVINKNDRSYQAYVAVWTMLIFACVLTLVHEMVVPIFPIPTLTAIQVIHVVEVILLSMALASRIRSLTLNETVAKAKIDAQAKFLARMSHEIRTPMNGIVGMSDLLIKRIKNETDRHYIEIIHSSAETLQQIINDILDYSKIEAGKLQLRQESFSIHDTLQGVCNLFELQCEQKHLQLTFKIEKDIPPYVSGDPHRIRQILINLVSNAVKYTEQGSVTVHVSLFDKSTLFQVIDTGEGISKKDQERLFQPFEQATNNNLGRESSTGLGLAICRELVNLMHGEMGVSSELNEGSTFWFALPLEEAEAPFKENDDSTLDIPLPVMNILVAEDNKVNKAVIKSMLRTLGMNFVIVGNGVEAVGYFKQAHEHIDIVLMDCEMPAMDGFKASEIIRNFEKEHYLLRTPIIALTAHTWHQELQHCYDSGMDELLLKPITRHSVESLLKRYITAIKRPREKLAEG